MNINDSSQFRECTSCQMCGAVCPVNAISISINEDGFYRPVVDDEKCIDCGICVKSCYKFDSNILSSKLEEKRIVAGWANDSSVINETTSGGIADIIARRLVSEGYTCVGVRYDADKNRAVGATATTEEETKTFRGSKYIQSLSVGAFKIIARECRDTKFAVFGLPCQIYAIDRFLKNRGVRDNHVLIDLYCHGCPSLNLWSKYVDGILNRVDGKKVLSVNFRSKARGWGNFYAVVVVEGVAHPIEVISPRISDPFYELFFSDEILNDSCFDCKLRSTLEYTDIRLGDFWGKSYIDNHTGVSGVTISTPKGAKVISMIESAITTSPQKFDNFLPYQSYGKIYKVNPTVREKLLAMLASKDSDMEECVCAYRKMLPFKTRIRHYLKNIVKLLPNGFISAIKKTFYRLQGK